MESFENNAVCPSVFTLFRLVLFVYSFVDAGYNTIFHTQGASQAPGKMLLPRINNDAFYSAALAKHGMTSQGVHWSSDHSQVTRFKMLCRFLPDDLGNWSIADAGCGFGDLYLYLQKEQQQPKRYTGLDIMPAMVTEARQRTGCEIRQCDILHDQLVEADYYLCSGAMNILTRFETHLFIRRCFAIANKGFMFNLLKGDDESMVYNYFLPREIKQLGRELGAVVRIKEGYLPRDFTVAFYK